MTAYVVALAWTAYGMERWDTWGPVRQWLWLCLFFASWTIAFLSS